MRFFLLILGASVLLITGCSDGRPERFPTSGQVLIDGQPVKKGFVRVIPQDGRASFGRIGANGSFSLTCFDSGDGCLPGTHAVEVIGIEVIGSNAQRWHAPQKYANAATSGLELTVEGPNNHVLIELTWDGGQTFVERMGRGPAEVMDAASEGLITDDAQRSPPDVDSE